MSRDGRRGQPLEYFYRQCVSRYDDGDDDGGGGGGWTVTHGRPSEVEKVPVSFP